MKHSTKKSLTQQSKDKKYKTELRIVFDAFFKQPMTMKELSVKYNVDRASICWYCREFRLNNQIAIVKKVYCSITKHLANRYTTNPALFPVSSQLKMF